MQGGLLEIPPEAAKIAASLRIPEQIHGEDFIFRFLEQLVVEREQGNRTEAFGRYYRDGRKSAKLIAEVVDNFSAGQKFLGRKWNPADFLDFASGYGCVARHLPRVLPAARVSAVDIHPQAVAFNKEVLGLGGWVSATEPEKLEVPLAGFDVVIALSFFSHLPKSMFGRWLKAIFGLLRKGGLAIFTTHGRVSHLKMPWISIDDDGYGFVARSEQRDLAGSDYGTAVTYPGYVLQRIGERKEVAIVRFQEALWWRHQDLYVAEKL
jgi:SAM-dependent methyltransferase